MLLIYHHYCCMDWLKIFSLILILRIQSNKAIWIQYISKIVTQIENKTYTRRNINRNHLTALVDTMQKCLIVTSALSCTSLNCTTLYYTTYSLTYLLTNLLTYLFTYLLTYSLTYLLTSLLTYLLLYLLTSSIRNGLQCTFWPNYVGESKTECHEWQASIASTR